MCEEIQLGNCIMSNEKPTVVSALDVVPKDKGDTRLIHDLSCPDGGVNKLAWETSVAYS
jgi:hypothetical protein